MKDFIKVERTFDVDKFFVGHAYHIHQKKTKESHTCLLRRKSPYRLEFVYCSVIMTHPLYLTPNDFNDDDYTITEAIYKVDIPEVRIVSEWKTIKDAFSIPGYFNNGDCYEIRIGSQIGPFSRVVKGFLSEYYPTKLTLRFVVHNVDTNVAAIRAHWNYFDDVTMNPGIIDGHEVIESSITNGAVLDIIPHNATDDVKIRRLS